LSRTICIFFHKILDFSTPLLYISLHLEIREVNLLMKEKKPSLAPETKEYIRNKVKELGSLAAVKRLYKEDCLVDNFANNFAKRFYKDEE